MTCSSASEAASIVDSMQQAQQLQMQKDHERDTSSIAITLPDIDEGNMDDDIQEDDMDMLDGKGVWLQKKGEGVGAALTGEKKRYFVLVEGKTTHMLKFTYFASVDKAGQPYNRKGYIPIIPSSSIFAMGKQILVVR